MNASRFALPGTLKLLLFVGLATSLTCGCRPLPQKDITSFSGAVTTEKNHSAEVFATVDELIAQASVDYAATQPTLSEASFTSGLDQNGLQTWEEAFAVLERYAQHLQSLTSPGLTQNFEDESVALAGELQAFGQRLQQAGALSQAPKLDPDLASGFTELGSLVIRLKAQANARTLLARADPPVRKVLLKMATSIGGSTAEGVRGTAKTHWNTLLAQKKVEFLATQDPAKRRELAASFQTMLQKRAAQDSALVSLRRSLLALADLHHALAAGQSADAQKPLQTLSDEFNHTLALRARFQENAGK